MKKIFILSHHLFLISFVILIASEGVTQSVGIGTNTPNAKAALEIKSTDKGVLFPRLTSAQRNAISNPPDGLHVFNTDERCLNFYDSIYKLWNCYCDYDTCKIVTINISSGCNIDFYNSYAINYPDAKRYVLLVDAGITLSCGNPTVGAINFATIPGFTSISIKIINRGSILAAGGHGGSGFTGHPGGPCYRLATAGNPGGSAVTTRPYVTIKIDNYGIVSGGGGGGGGGGGAVAGEYGGGGGGGAGTTPGSGGIGGGTTIAGPFSSCATQTSIAQGGTVGQLTTGGGGGTGSNGGTGGSGGNRGQQGQNGTGTNPGIGGAAGKAIAGGIGNVINNLSGGQSFGTVD